MRLLPKGRKDLPEMTATIEEEGQRPQHLEAQVTEEGHFEFQAPAGKPICIFWS